MNEPEAESPPPHAGEHLTREDVERLIDEHGGPEGLDLMQADLRQADLSRLNLQGAYLSWTTLEGADLSWTSLQGAYLVGANLKQADLSWAKLQAADLSAAKLQAADLSVAELQGTNLHGANLREADLGTANLQGANLGDANLQGANLYAANLQGANLYAANLQGANLYAANLRDANLQHAKWGDYKLGDEIAGDFHAAPSVYRTLKQRHTEAGMYDIAGEFHYREMEVRRKLAWQERRLPYALTMYALRFLYGYGERPWRVIGWAAAVVFGLAFVHWAFGTVAGGFLDALYYSAVSFPALGYGHWAPEPQGWAGRFLGAGESFLGVFMMALFLVTFTRKMTR